jgi:hypothetical protein
MAIPASSFTINPFVYTTIHNDEQSGNPTPNLAADFAAATENIVNNIHCGTAMTVGGANFWYLLVGNYVAMYNIVGANNDAVDLFK